MLEQGEKVEGEMKKMRERERLLEKVKGLETCIKRITIVEKENERLRQKVETLEGKLREIDNKREQTNMQQQVKNMQQSHNAPLTIRYMTPMTPIEAHWQQNQFRHNTSRKCRHTHPKAVCVYCSPKIQQQHMQHMQHMQHKPSTNAHTQYMQPEHSQTNTQRSHRSSRKESASQPPQAQPASSPSSWSSSVSSVSSSHMEVDHNTETQQRQIQIQQRRSVDEWHPCGQQAQLTAMTRQALAEAAARRG